MIEFIAGCMAGVAIAKKVRAIADWKPEIQTPFKAKVEIVKFGENRYAIRKKALFERIEFFGVRQEGNPCWWSKTYLNEYCIGTLDECKTRLPWVAVGDGEAI